MVILNLFQDNAPQSPVILKQVQDDEAVEAALFLQIIREITGTGWRETSVAANPSMACGC
jgi:hypothetical protein